MNSQLPESIASTDPAAGDHRLKDDICVHIFSVSAGMVGVCLTVIGIFQVGELRRIGSLADNILAVDASIFLFTCITSYFAMRSKDLPRRDRIERVADWMFLLALILMATVCFVIAYELF